MKSALAGTNLQAAVAMAKVLGDAAHDLTHDFYGVWLPQTKGRPLPAMATHVPSTACHPTRSWNMR